MRAITAAESLLLLAAFALGLAAALALVAFGFLEKSPIVFLSYIFVLLAGLLIGVLWPNMIKQRVQRLHDTKQSNTGASHNEPVLPANVGYGKRTCQWRHRQHGNLDKQRKNKTDQK